MMPLVSSVHNRWGEAVAWIASASGLVYDLRGRVLAVAKAGVLQSPSGARLGFHDNGVFRDLEGRIVAFTSGSAPGIPLPIPQVSPAKPVFEVASAQFAVPADPLTPRITEWSALSSHGSNCSRATPWRTAPQNRLVNRRVAPIPNRWCADRS